MSSDVGRSIDRRADLVDQLWRDDVIRSPAWRDATLAVPREVFLPRFFDQGANPEGFTEYRPVSPASVGEARWLDLVYQDETWVTQIDHDDASWDDLLPRTGTPTSSSTKPSVVVRMLEDLEADDGMRVLEVGTGTGYSTALTCARLGDSLVTSVEYDRALSRRAGERLTSLGYHPVLVVGDGAAGHPPRAPYDRIIATYSPPTVPSAWLHQAAPGAAVLVAVAGGLNTYGYVRLIVGPSGVAEGRFLNSDVSFMPSRTTTMNRFRALMRDAHAQRPSAAGRQSVADPGLLNDPSFRWAAQLFVPDIALVTTADGETVTQWLLAPDGSWAAVETSLAENDVLVYEGGRQPLWTQLEATAQWWDLHDRPGVQRYRLRVTTETNVVTIDGADDTWTRPS